MLNNSVFCILSVGRGCRLQKVVIKETHTIYFSSSLYVINQKYMIPRNHFHCITTWVAHSSG